MTWVADRLLVVEDFIAADTAAFLAAHVRNHTDPVVTLTDSSTPGDIAFQLRNIALAVTREATVFYQTAMRVESLFLTAKKHGAWDEPHADAERRTPAVPHVPGAASNTSRNLVPGPNWEPNHSAQRRAVGLCYLTDDYGIGGDLCFAQLGITMHPRAGRLVVFPSQALFEHYVTPIPGGRARCAIACWMTREDGQ